MEDSGEREGERGREGGTSQRGRTKFISPPSARYRGRCDARFPPGKKSIAIRKLAPPNDDIHPLRSTSRSPRACAPLPPPRIPRNSAAGDWRWRPRALRDKPDQHQRAEPDNPRRTNTSSSSRRGPETFAGLVRVSGRAGVSSVSSTEANLLPSLFVPSSTDSGVVEYLDRSSAGYNAVETNSRARVAPRG